jgi:hypothetical protein
MASKLEFTMEVEQDMDETSKRAHEFTSRRKRMCRVRLGNESVTQYIARVNAEGMLDEILLQGDVEDQHYYIERLSANGLLAMATERKEGEDAVDYAARMRDRGLFDVVTRRWHGELDVEYFSRIARAGLLVSSFAAKEDESQKMHAARLRGCGVLVSLLQHAQGKSDDEVEAFLDTLGLREVYVRWEAEKRKQSPSTEAANALFRRWQDVTLGRDEAEVHAELDEEADDGTVAGAALKGTMQLSRGGMAWRRAHQVIDPVKLHELLQLENLCITAALQTISTKRNSLVQEPDLTTVHEAEDDEPEAEAASSAHTVVPSEGIRASTKPKPKKKKPKIRAIQHKDNTTGDAEPRLNSDLDGRAQAEDGGQVQGPLDMQIDVEETEDQMLAHEFDDDPTPDADEKEDGMHAKKPPRRKLPPPVSYEAAEQREIMLLNLNKRSSKKTLPSLQQEMYQLKVGELENMIPEPATPMTAGITSPVIQYLNGIVGISNGKLDQYRKVFDHQCEEGATELSLDQLTRGMSIVNHNLPTDNTIDYCLTVLDVVNEALQEKAPYDFKLFSVVCRLAERMTYMQGPVANKVEALMFNGAEELLKFQVIKARSLFYLGASEAAHGTLSFDDFRAVCVCGTCSFSK